MSAIKNANAMVNERIYIKNVISPAINSQKYLFSMELQIGKNKTILINLPHEGNLYNIAQNIRITHKLNF